MARIPYSERPLVWIGSSRDDISALPAPVKMSFGYRLRQVQQGKMPDDAKALAQFGGGVFELREAFDTDAYRVVYAVKLEKAVYVLHAFMKKSTTGKALPKRDTELIAARLKRAKDLDAQDQDTGAKEQR